MNPFKHIFKNEKRGYTTNIEQNPLLGTLNLYNSNYTESQSMKIAAVYRAVNIIADSVSVLPLDTYKYKENWKYKEYSNLWNLLNIAPNNLMTAYSFKRLMVQNILLAGNNYIYINRDLNNTIKGLYILEPTDIQVHIINNEKIYYNKKLKITYDSSDIIHNMNYAANGLIGQSTLKFASMSLETAYNSEEYANNFFAGGGALAGIITPTAANLTDSKAEKVKEKIINATSAKSLNGMTNSILVLENSMQYSPVQIKPQEAQLLESRKFNILNIAQWFGVPPAKLFDLQGATYASAESSQIDFLNSTLLPLLEKIENDLYTKLYLPTDYDKTDLKFDVSNLLRLDAQTQADVFSKYINVGVYSINEVRERLNANYPVANANRHFIGQNMQPLDNILNDIKNNKEVKSDENNISNNNVVVNNSVVDDVQKTALNGAQITSLMVLLTSVASGIISKESAKAVIAAAFPTFNDKQINDIINSLEIKENKNNEINNNE